MRHLSSKLKSSNPQLLYYKNKKFKSKLIVNHLNFRIVIILDSQISKFYLMLLTFELTLDYKNFKFKHLVDDIALIFNLLEILQV